MLGLVFAPKMISWEQGTSIKGGEAMSQDSSRRRTWLGVAISVVAVAGGLVGLSLSASARNVTARTPAMTVARQAPHARPAPPAHHAAVMVSATVGDSGFADVGAEAEGCTSAAPSQVACGVP